LSKVLKLVKLVKFFSFPCLSFDQLLIPYRYTHHITGIEFYCSSCWGNLFKKAQLSVVQIESG